MAETYRNTYTFHSQAAPDDAFAVVRFTGEEGLSRLYAFDILLMTSRRDLDLAALAQSPAVFRLKLDQGELPIHGIPARFEMQDASQGYVFYRVVLVPKLWWLTLTRHNQIFLDKDIQGFLTDALTDGGLNAGADFEFRLSRSSPARAYVCQYRESHFDFISRWMERDGLYYFFEQTPAGEKMVITDTRSTHVPLAGSEPLDYLPSSGLDGSVGTRSVKQFSRTRGQVPRAVDLADYNYRTPGKRLQGQGQVSPHGHGVRRIFGEHAQTEAEAAALAKVRAEELACRETVYEGASAAPHVRPGFLFRLERHFRDAINATYLTTTVRHEGGQEAYLSQTLGIRLAGAPEMPYYRNTFTAIAADVQFRASQVTPKPRFYGVFSAKIDASQSGQYAELDDQGRYKVILPFDLSGRGGGKASSWLRMVQPYGGAGHGLHFPLHKGCEVLLVFVDGDPDRPAIQAAVPNPENKSLVTDANGTKCQLTTSGGNQIHFENQEGSERILMQSPTKNSWLRCGYPNDPPSTTPSQDMWGVKFNTDGAMLCEAGLYNMVNLGTTEWEYFGSCSQNYVGEAFSFYGAKQCIGLATNTTIDLVSLALRLKAQHALGETVALNDECIALANEEIALRGDTKKLEAMRLSLKGKINRLEAIKRELTDTHHALEGEIQQLTAVRDDLQQKNESLNAISQRLDNDIQTLGAETQDLNLQHQTICSQISTLAANQRVAAAQRDTMAEQVQSLAAMKSTIVAHKQVT